MKPDPAVSLSRGVLSNWVLNAWSSPLRLIPRQAGDRIKTDRRDAEKLARLLRAGELSAVYVPDPTDEAIRDLCRARTDAVDDRRRACHRLKAFLLRHGFRYTGKSSWTPAHMRYLRELVLPHPAMKVILEDYLCAIDAAHERVRRCEQAMEELLVDWQLRPAVQALMAFKGFQIVAAMILISELGNITRFENPRQSWPTSAWCLRNLPAATSATRAASPNVETLMLAGCWSNAPSITPPRRRSAKNFRGVRKAT
jgi:transposase